MTFIQSMATPLVDLSLYVSAENYNTATSSAYTAILPWYANFTVPPKRRELARARTAHMGLSSLDVDTTAEERFAPGRGTASSEYEAAKEAAGIPTDKQPNTLSMGRGRGFGGFLVTHVYAARFRLDALSHELLEPLSDLLGDKDYLLAGDTPSSLDCLAFGYLALLFYPMVPQAWSRETIQNKFPRIATYVQRMRKAAFLAGEVDAATVWAVSTDSIGARKNMLLPWQPNSQAFASSTWAATCEIVGNIPVLSSIRRRSAIAHAKPSATARHTRSSLPTPLVVNTLLGLTAATAVGLASLSLHHRRSPREGALIFWALRPESPGLGEAGDILRAFGGGAFSQF
jgi:glutathione S-transferase